jgi:uncharacterized protein YraI
MKALLFFSAISLAIVTSACATNADAVDDVHNDGADADETGDEAASVASDDLTGNHPIGTTYVTTSAVNLRKGPSKTDEIILEIPAGAEVKSASSAAKGVWYGVTYQGKTGWVHGAYIQLANRPGACPAKDRTAARIADLPFQTLERGNLTSAMTGLSWVYPWKNGQMPNNFGAGRNYNEGHEGADLGGTRGDGIYAASAGKIAYVLTTCTDNDVRKDKVCGNGWGNHVVVDHGQGVFTRYAHLQKVKVAVGDSVGRGQMIGELGHSGLSDGPHLHFELGVKASAFEKCAPPQNFDKVYNPAKLRLSNR